LPAAVPLETNYDEVPYPSLSYAPTHPDRLATLAILLGMDPAPVEQCRVLELGCAGGGNIVPMAYVLPDAEFLGIDASGRQIEGGQAVVEALSLENIALEHVNILDITPEWGVYDYIIAHGVYSWVPPEVQASLLRVCKDNLAPNGVAYVSYNTYPGWHTMNIVRDAMLYHARNLTDPQQRAHQAEAMVAFLAGFASSTNDAYVEFFRTYLELLGNSPERNTNASNAFLLHNELEAINEPLYFHEFAECAANHGLQYLVEAEFSKVFPDELDPEAKEALYGMADDTISFEQYLDFLTNRMFRRTLLCHADVEVQRSLSPELVRDLYVASGALPVAEAAGVDISGDTVEDFRSVDNATLSTDHPTTKAAMLYLQEVWPRAVAFQDLVVGARDLAGAGAIDRQQDAFLLAANLLRAYGYSTHLVALHAYVPPAKSEISSRPVASAVARIQAQDSDLVTNLWHERVDLDDFDRALLQFMDGAHDHDALVREMTDLVPDGVLATEREEVQVDGRDQLRNLVVTEVDIRLRRLAGESLLIG
jgi:methyltransferase-like protein/SAM-dependent methyltransferase